MGIGDWSFAIRDSEICLSCRRGLLDCSMSFGQGSSVMVCGLLELMASL